MKVAILSSGDLSDMKGVMNFVHEKAKHILKQCQVENISLNNLSLK